VKKARQPTATVAHPETAAPEALEELRSIQVDELPYPATKLTITRHLYVSTTPRFWAYLIIGAFYDAEGVELWRREIILFYRGDTRGYSLETGDYDHGPPPPEWALAGELFVVIIVASVD